MIGHIIIKIVGRNYYKLLNIDNNILKTADLPAAVKALESLPENSKAVAAEWIRDAKARLAAERAIAALHVYAVAYMAPVQATAPKNPAKE